jgi:alpha-1,2-mannosyltransferase
VPQRVEGSGVERRDRGTLTRSAAPCAAWLAVALVAAAQVHAALDRPLPDRLADLHVYVASVRLLRDGGSLYDFAAANGAPFTYPPLAGLVFHPLGVLDEELLRPLWIAVLLAAVVLTARVVARGDGVHRLLPPGLPVPAVALLLVASQPVSANIRFGQVSLLLVLPVLLDCAGPPAPRRPLWSIGIGSGLAGAIKLTPLIFLPYLWFAGAPAARLRFPAGPAAGRHRAGLTAAAAFVTATVLAWALLPGESARFWLAEIWEVSRIGDLSAGGNQSLNGALLRWGLPEQHRLLLLGLLGPAVMAVALVRAVRAARNARPLAGTVIMGTAGLLVSPVSWTHHQVWLVLAALLTISHRRAPNLVWTAFAAAITILPVTRLPAAAITGDLRMLLAFAVACLIPFSATRHSPVTPSMRSRSRSAWPRCRAYSLMR